MHPKPTPTSSHTCTCISLPSFFVVCAVFRKTSQSDMILDMDTLLLVHDTGGNSKISTILCSLLFSDPQASETSYMTPQTALPLGQPCTVCLVLCCFIVLNRPLRPPCPWSNPARLYTKFQTPVLGSVRILIPAMPYVLINYEDVEELCEF